VTTRASCVMVRASSARRITRAAARLSREARAERASPTGDRSTLQRLRIHSLSVTSARRAAIRHVFISRGLSRRCTLIERAEGTQDLLPVWFTLVNTALRVVTISSRELLAIERPRACAPSVAYLLADQVAVSDAPLRSPRRDPDPRGPCGNEDCSRCYPHQRWFCVRTDTLERRRHARNLRASSAEAARSQYDEGTAWPSDYDSHTTETLEASEAVVEEISNPHLFTGSGGVTIDITTCWWDLPSDLLSDQVPDPDALSDQVPDPNALARWADDGGTPC